jgi:hypothetical protein
MLPPLPKTSSKLPFEGSEIGDYFTYAIKIYLDSKVNLKNIPPMIIFPKLSFFSLTA